MDILEPGRTPSFWKEFQNKLIQGVPLPELHRDIALKMTSLLAEVEEILVRL
jgi:hypothetical protein